MAAEQVPALAADVRRVQPADLGGRGREGHNLVGSTEMPGNVDQAGRQPDRAVGHGLADEPAHAIQLRLRRSPLREAEHLLSDRAVADQRREVHRGLGFVDRVEVVVPAGPPWSRDRTRFPVGQADGLVPRRRRPRRGPAVPDDDRRHPLAHGARHLGEQERRQVGVVVDVDESRRHDEVVRTDRARCLGSGSSSLPTPTIRSPSTATQPANAGAAVPSTIEPLRTRSAIGAR